MSAKEITVWIVNEAGHSYEKAKELLGPNIRFSHLTEDDINPHHVDRLSKHIAKGITKYAKADDYVLISGTPMVNVLAVWIWLLFFKECKILQWDAKHRCYKEYTLNEGDTRDMMQKVLERG